VSIVHAANILQTFNARSAKTEQQQLWDRAVVMNVLLASILILLFKINLETHKNVDCVCQENRRKRNQAF
jgi:hypothetical protein